MSYGFIDDGLWRNKKARTWTSHEGWLWVNCISYCREHKASRGFISEEDIAIVAAMHKIPKGTIQGLIDKKGLDAAADGYVVHDYAAVYERKRAAAHARWHAEPDADAHAEGDAEGHAETMRPTPTPTPTPTATAKEGPLEKPTEEEGQVVLKIQALGIRTRLRERTTEALETASRKGAKNRVAFLMGRPESGRVCLLEDLAIGWREEDNRERKEQESTGSVHRIGDVLAALPIPRRTA